MVDRSKVIYYARFLMIIANYLCKELSIEDRNDTLKVFVQGKGLFTQLVTKNLYPEVEFVLPQHVRMQLSTLYSLLVPPTMQDVRQESTSTAQVELQTQSQSGTKASSSVSQFGKRKKTTLHTLTEGCSSKNGTATKVQSPQKKKDARKVKTSRNLIVVDHEVLPAETNNTLVLDPPPLLVEQKPKRDLLFLLELAQAPNDHQHLMNAAVVLKSQLVAHLTSYANILSTENMTDLADKCYNTLRKLGDNSTSFNTEVNKLISQHQELALATKKKENLNERDIKERYVQKVVSLSDATKKLSRAQDILSTAKTDAASLKLKREELLGELLKNKVELSKERERVKTLTAEREECKEAITVVESELGKLDAEKEAAREAFEAINDQYYADKKEFERISNQLLQLVSK
ncbi:hypothetical protein POM88_034682 [Heracleum sosnowskyi]|uniref:Uncharacterized protein n=1 Tax=Heracleum sosnowskyi TaxID=360622 RepID=A0AAD8HLZ7_9APIA|nr:hypothetical protein POM88_034682 [Heracleum sosnowskyi]